VLGRGGASLVLGSGSDEEWCWCWGVAGLVWMVLLRGQAARGRPHSVLLQNPEGVHPALGASSARRSGRVCCIRRYLTVFQRVLYILARNK
jgi:hypothetical protein